MLVGLTLIYQTQRFTVQIQLRGFIGLIKRRGCVDFLDTPFQNLSRNADLGRSHRLRETRGRCQANGGQQQYELEVVSKISEVAVREIVLITKHAFLVTNNRSEGRFSTSAIERILELVFDLGCLEKPIKYRQISNLQRKYGDDKSDPLTDNQMDVIF